jgi:uncharacterized protein YjbI with pentapeptide repeats
MADFTREEVLEIAHKLENSDLEGLDLSNAYLRETNLTGSDLNRADLIATNLSRAYLHGAEYNKNTKFPDDFDPEEAGMVLEE